MTTNRENREMSENFTVAREVSDICQNQGMAGKNLVRENCP